MKLAWALAYVGLWGAALAAPGGLGPPLPLAAVFLLVVWLLEGRSVLFPSGEAFSTAPAFVLATPGAPWTASLMGLLGVLVAPWRSSVARLRWLVWLQAGVAAAAWGGVPAGAVVWLLASEMMRFQPQVPVNEVRLRDQGRWLRASVACAAVVIARLGPWGLLLGPGLLMLQAGAANLLFRLRAGEATVAIDRLEQTQQALDVLRGEKADEAELLHKQRLLEGFSAHLAEGHRLAETVRSVVDTARELVPARSFVIFIPDAQGVLMPVGAHSPEGDRLEGAALTGLREPLVQRAWEEGRLFSSQACVEPDRLLPLETTAAALPCHGVAVLYVGRAGTAPYTPKQLESLSYVADKAGLALRAALRLESQQQQLARHEVVASGLQGRLTLLESLVQGGQQLAVLLRPEELVSTLPAVFTRLVPHHSGALWMGGALQAAWGPAAPRLAEGALEGLVRSLSRPLLFPDLATSRFAVGGDFPRSAMLAPVGDGALLLLAQAPGVFSDEHLQVLSLSASQLATSLGNARLYAQVVAQRQQLESSHAQLVQASKLSAIGQLAAGVAHELNTPLGAVSLSLEMLEVFAGSLDEKCARQVEICQDALEKAQQIVDKLLVYSRKSEQRLERVDLTAVCQGALELVEAELRKRRRRVELTGSVSGLVHARSVEIQQVLVNLVLNAADAYVTSEREGAIEVALVEYPEFLGFEVRDRAGGIPEDVLDKIFDPFFTTKPVGKGTGLGLSISREIVTGFSGTLEVRTSPEGTVFRMLLPRLVLDG